ncbi:MAG: amidophosphoribosyltransferase [Anaerolineales bacterium]
MSEVNLRRYTGSMFSDQPHEACGIFGIDSPREEAVQFTYYGLHAVQHRGQESAGIAVSDGLSIDVEKRMGLVDGLFSDNEINTLTAKLAIGHTRYSTTGGSSLQNAQPFLLETRHGPVALAHNGNLVNADALREKLLTNGMGLTSSSDSEVMVLMLAGAPGDTWLDRLAHAMQDWVGAYSLVILTVDGVFAARDPWGLRPLTVGLLPEGGHAVCSETSALDIIGCEAVREVRPGEVVALHDAALIVRQAIEPAKPLALCTFEHIYFSRPDSVWDGQVVYQVRRRIGRELALEGNVDADMVVPVPDSSIPAAMGYAEESGIPFEMALVKDSYVGRTFIRPEQDKRERSVYMKFNPIRSVLEGKRVVLVDDSIVRGTTARRLVNTLRDAGAEQVHMRLTCPPLTHPCFMGVDMPTREELVASSNSVSEINDILGTDSLRFLSLEGMMRAIGSESGYCNACFTGKYPFEVIEELVKERFG